MLLNDHSNLTARAVGECRAGNVIPVTVQPQACATRVPTRRRQESHTSQHSRHSPHGLSAFNSFKYNSIYSSVLRPHLEGSASGHGAEQGTLRRPSPRLSASLQTFLKMRLSGNPETRRGDGAANLSICSRP